MDKLTAYLEQTLPQDEKWLELETYAKENHIPIMESVSMHFLLTLLKMYQPKEILEIGTAIGYSALRIADTLPDARITTMEKDSQMKEIAIRNVKHHSASNQIQILYGDAVQLMEEVQLEGKRYDFIFIDAAKGQYERFFNLADSLLNKEGIIICDNILFRGYVAETVQPAHKRFEKLALKLQSFNEKLMQDIRYKTTIIPIGDGLSLSVRK